MAVFDFTEAVSFVGRHVLVELVFPDENEVSDSLWSCVFVVGVVFSAPGIYEHPHFLGFSLGYRSPYPEEFFWERIKTIAPMGRALRVR